MLHKPVVIMKQQKTVTLFTYIHAVDELIRKSRSSQQVVAAHPSDWAAADLFFLSSGMWMRPKNKRMMTKRIPPPPTPRLRSKDFKEKKRISTFAERYRQAQQNDLQQPGRIYTAMNLHCRTSRAVYFEQCPVTSEIYWNSTSVVLLCVKMRVAY